MRWLALALLLTACAPLSDRPDKRARIAEAEILEMLRDCLRRKQAEPSVDCSQYRLDRSTIRVEPR